MKQMKRLVSALLAICMIMVMIPVTVSAAESGTCGDNVTWTLSDDGVLTISGTGPMWDYEMPEDDEYYIDSQAPWLFCDVAVTKVIIEDGITSIGDWIFADCFSMVSITIPDSVKKIGNGAFYRCNSLVSVIIPDGVPQIGWNVFYGCSSLTNVTLPNSIKTIGEESFTYCTSLRSITIPSSVTQIEAGAEYGAFGCCFELSTIYFCGNAPSIGYNTFEWGVTATVYYPANNPTWTSDKLQDYGGNITWVSYKAEVSQPLEAPVIKGSNKASNGKISLTWEAVEGASKYEVYRATSKNGKYSLMKALTNTTYTNTSAKAGKYYYYFVRAIDADGNYADSNIIGRTCDLAQTTITVSNVASTGKVKISWTAVEGATKYQVYRATSKNGTYSRISTTANTSVTNTKAEAGKTYYYKVRAICDVDAAAAAYSAVKSRTCDLPRPDVSIALSSKKPKVSWDKVTGAVEYKVYRATSKTGTYSLVKTTTASYYRDTKATAGKTYYYKVVAVCSNTAGNSAYSSIVSIKSK